MAPTRRNPSGARGDDRREPGKTVDLIGFDPAGFRSLVVETWFGDFPGAGDPPDATIPALARVDAAARSNRGDVFKVPRAPLVAWVAFLRNNTTPKRRDFRETLDKIAARLERRRGRPPSRPDVWPMRADAVKRAVRALERASSYAPTDAQVEAAMGLTAATLRRWRRRKPDLFGSRAPHRR